MSINDDTFGLKPPRETEFANLKHISSFADNYSNYQFDEGVAAVDLIKTYLI